MEPLPLRFAKRAERARDLRPTLATRMVGLRAIRALASRVARLEAVRPPFIRTPM